MRFSLFYNFATLADKNLSELYKEVEMQAVVAEIAGFDAVWLAEHHFECYGRMPDPLLFLARLSALTQELELGTAVVEAPYYQPLRLAEDVALLDVLSKGRVRLGIGSGGANKATEFIRFGIPFEEKTERTIEITEILRQAFDDGRVNFFGHYYSYQDIEIQPRALRPAHQLIWLAANHTTPEIAGQHGYGLLIPRVGLSTDPDQLIQRYRNALEGKPGRVSLSCFIFVAETEREAQERT